MSGTAYVTVVYNDESAIGAVVLAESLHTVAGSSPRDLVALIINDNLKSFSRQLLQDVFTHVYSTRDLCSNDDLALLLLGRPDISYHFGKIHCWRLTQYQKCVYMEADTLVLSNCDDLFEREELSAVPDVGWPDCFNAGVFVFQASLKTYADMVSLLNSTTKYNYEGGDQGLMNAYFVSWKNDLTKRLPFVFNVTPSAHYTYAPAFQRFSSAIKVIHFYKPWSAPWPTELGGRSADFMDTWATIFKNKVLPKLNETAQQLVQSSRSGSATELLRRHEQPLIERHPAPPPGHVTHYQQHHYSENTSSYQMYSEPVQVQSHHQFETHSTPSESPRELPRTEEYHHDQFMSKPLEEQHNYTTIHEYKDSHEVHHSQNDDRPQNEVYEEPHSIPVSTPISEPLDPHWDALLWNTVKSPWEPPMPVQIEDFKVTGRTQEESPEESPPTFGWFSSDTGARPPSDISNNAEAIAEPEPSLPPSRSIEDEATEKEDDEETSGAVTEEKSIDRMKAWEEGNIDYMGKDKFDNIWRHLEMMLSESVKISGSSVSDQEEEDEFELEKVLELGDVEVPDEIEVTEANNWPGYPEGDWSGMYEWQEGRIDYTGKDRSDNILKRLDLVMSGGIAPYTNV